MLSIKRKSHNSGKATSMEKAQNKQAKSKFKALMDFPYFDHYLKLAHLEYQLSGLKDNSKVIFIGSGPLPLTPISLAIIQLAKSQGKLDLLMQAVDLSLDQDKPENLVNVLDRIDAQQSDFSFSIICVDKEKEAIEKSKELLKALCLDKIIDSTLCDGCHLETSSDFDTYFIASMVHPKTEVIENILSRCPQDKTLSILVRSVEENNLRELLYAPAEAELEAIKARFPTFAKRAQYFPDSQSKLINSFYVYQYANPKKAQDSWLDKEGEDLRMNENHIPFWHAFIEKTKEKDLSEKKILDFGCGCGGFLRELYMLKPFSYGLGVDLASNSIKVANQIKDKLPYAEKLNYAESSILKQIDFKKNPQEKFDLAFSYEVIYLLPDLIEHARQMAQILKPGGVYYAATGCHTKCKLWPKWQPLIEKTSKLKVPSYSPEDFVRAFEEIGFAAEAAYLNYSGFVDINKYPDYFPDLESTLNYYLKDMLVFRFQAPSK